MDNCLVKKLKATVNNDNLPNLLQKVFAITGNENTGYNTVKVIGAVLREGVLYSDTSATTVAVNQGDTLGSSDYYVKSGDTIKLTCNYNSVTNITFYSNLLYVGLNDFAPYKNLDVLWLRFTRTSGTLESFIKEHIKYRGSSNFVLDMLLTNTLVTLNNASITERLNASCSGNVVTIYKQGSPSTVYATYTISTDTWSYPS